LSNTSSTWSELGVSGAARRGHDTVGIDRIRNDCRFALEADLIAMQFDRGFARSHVAAGLAFGRRRGHQQLVSRDAAQNAFERSTALGVSQNAAHLDLVHRVN
jgi:hypothetical protein